MQAVKALGFARLGGFGFAQSRFEPLRHLGEILIDRGWRLRLSRRRGQARLRARLRTRFIWLRPNRSSRTVAREQRRDWTGCGSSASAASASRCGRGGVSGSGGGGGKFVALLGSAPLRGPRRGGAGGSGGPAGSGCNGQEPFDGASGRGMTRGRVSAATGGRAEGASRAAGVARTMFASTTTSVGPPIIRRCSTLSRRTRMSRRRASTLA